MKLLLCNPRNSQGTKHSRKGMYVPLGILSIATCLYQHLGDRLAIEVIDEDVTPLTGNDLERFDAVGFYATTFNYTQAVEYAYRVKEVGGITILGGPHSTVLAENIMRRRRCFDYIVRYEAEIPMTQLMQALIENRTPKDLNQIPNLVYRQKIDAWTHNPVSFENDLNNLPIPSRSYVPVECYVDNYRSVYPRQKDAVPGSIYSSKGCSWRDRTGGCIFCARLEQGVRFRPIEQIWREIEMLKDLYGVNLIWDIADDNLNNPDWFKAFVNARPNSCRDIRFFIYSRVTPIKNWVIPYFKKLNVDEVFLGVESGDNRLLRASFKGQTREVSFRALKLLNEHGIKFFPSFVLGLPGESIESLDNTLTMCSDIAGLGGLDRISATILKPIPGSIAFQQVIEKTRFGTDLAEQDDIDLAFLERFWVERFTNVDYTTMMEYREKINQLMGVYHVFGSAVSGQQTDEPYPDGAK